MTEIQIRVGDYPQALPCLGKGRRMAKASVAAGLDVGTVAGTGEAAKALVRRGARICINSVANLIKSSAKPFLEQGRS